MAKPVLLICGSYHFGDGPGTFQDATYIGHQLVLPVRKVWLDDRADHVSFYFSTHDVETVGDWRGHRVTINGTEIGRIKNHGHTAGDVDTTKLDVALETLVKLLGGKDYFSLAIELEKRHATPGMADDFVLTRIATSASLSLALGWQE